MEKIIIKTSARLHFNSLKMNQFGGRGCGGIGVALDEPSMEICLSVFNKVVVSGGNAVLRRNAQDFVKKILDYFNIKSGVKIKITKYFCNQSGLGSGTQLGLGIGRGISLLFKKKISPIKLASVLGVAGVSGIGFYAFSQGGFVVDGGYKMGKNEEKKNFGEHSLTPPPLICRWNFPSKWKIVLITPKETDPRIFSVNEKKLFSENTPIGLKEVGTICTNVLMGVLPSLQERDYFNFMRHLSKIINIGTKKIELELNQKSLNYVNNCLSSLLDYKITKINRERYKLISSDLGRKNNKYSKDKLPFLMLSSLGNTFYSIILEGYHDVDLIMNGINNRLSSDWKAIVTSVNNKGARVNIVK